YKVWKDYLQYNVHATDRLLRFAIECNVKLFVFISGADVYGTIPARLPADPWTAANPEDYYQKSKWKAEQLVVKLLRGRIPFVILRPSRIYGAQEHGFLEKLTSLVKTNAFPLIRKGVKIHLTDVETVGRVVQWLLNSEMTDEAIYNVADRSPVLLSELVDLIYSFFYSKNYLDYLRLHPVFFKMGENVSRVLQLKQLSLDFKQISESWYYDITSLSETCPFELPLTMERVAYYLELQHKAVD
ncbi:MAG: NAD-dependent epimerase/dehydratase family protein, partial [Calditrichia bacterium]